MKFYLKIDKYGESTLFIIWSEIRKIKNILKSNFNAYNRETFAQIPGRNVQYQKQDIKPFKIERSIRIKPKILGNIQANLKF